MESFELDFPMLAVIMTLICCVVVLISFTALLRLKREQRQYIKKAYPELTKIDLKYRRIKIANYQQLYLNSRFKNIFQMISLFGIIIGIIIVCLSLIFNELINTSLLILPLGLYLIAFLLLSQPSINKQYDFWRNYLERHPDNPLKISLPPVETAKKIRNNTKTIGICYVIMATISLGMFIYFT